MTADDLTDYDPQDYPEALAWFRECKARRARDREARVILETTNANLHDHIIGLRAYVAQLEHVLSQTRDERIAEVEAELAATKVTVAEQCEWERRTRAELRQERDELRKAMRTLGNDYNALSTEHAKWQEEARSYCQNASYHRQKREQAEAEVSRLQVHEDESAERLERLTEAEAECREHIEREYEQRQRARQAEAELHKLRYEASNESTLLEEYKAELRKWKADFRAMETVAIDHERELEALTEAARKRHNDWCAACREVETLKAELAALKARRCETCAYTMVCLGQVDTIGEPMTLTCCSRWEAKP